MKTRTHLDSGSYRTTNLRRNGSIVITLLGGLLFVAVFFSVYCYKQWQVNRQARPQRPAAQAPQDPRDTHRWLSPDKKLAFQLPPIFSLGRKQLKLVDHQTGRVLAAIPVEERAVRCDWREDSQACAVELQLAAGRSDVVLLLVNGNQIHQCRPTSAIYADQFLPQEGRGKARWQESVGLLGFCDDGDLQIEWLGSAHWKPPGGARRMTRAVCQFKVGYTPAGKVVVVEQFPIGRPQTIDR